MTPLQRYVLLEGFKQQSEEVEQAQADGGGPRVNSMARPNGGGAGDTTTFVNVGSDEQE